jgi:DNA-binding XRE family transcriptional regulator
MSNRKPKPRKRVRFPSAPREERINLNRLRELRQRGVVLTQEQVAAVCGFDVTTVNAHENGRRALTRAAAQKYADLYTNGAIDLLFNIPGLEPDPVCSECGQVMPPGKRKDVIKSDKLTA